MRIGCTGVDSRPGSGSTFRFRLALPFAPVAGAVARAIAVTGIGPNHGPAARVLLVEDDAVNQLIAVRMLAKLGSTVDVAVDRRQAVERAAGGTYDLVLMDCQMPVLDGFAATEAIRARQPFADLPIVALTANVVAAIASGAWPRAWTTTPPSRSWSTTWPAPSGAGPPPWPRAGRSSG
jgi:CheY-like chemotaxis protein